ncbi:hypothetical protein ASE76_13930 [Xylophilus sp. Leaf220]|nr:hypothetical protein ASE76_13930 [Xylophilus sp. Leaf220]
MGGEAVVAFDEDGELPDGMVLIPQSKVRFSAGDGQFFIEDDVQDDAPPAAYRLSWFSGQGMNPSRVRRFEVKGNSMSPTLFDGDRALVDMGETEIIDGRVYAIRYGDELKMKRVYKRLDGGLILHSDNPDHRPQDEELPAALVQEQIAVIGRVRERAGHGGL